MLAQTIPLHTPLTVTAEPLTPSSFAPFGAVLANPAPEKLPPLPQDHQDLPPGVGAVVANQGTAIQYRALAPPLRDLYAGAPSGRPSEPRTTMFVCGARSLLSSPSAASSASSPPEANEDDGTSAGFFEVKILERHPFTTQTFAPLGASSASTRYLVIVAPSLPSAPEDSSGKFPAPARSDALPGPGLPDLRGLRAFVATGRQAVTYGAGTWHAPMAALGAPGSALDFVVVQFANDVPREDCQEVALKPGGERGDGGGAPRIMVRVPPGLPRLARL
ncbi:ureidoglycolate hydrolase [Hypoxylon sp. FL1284]|nr:ureidoglycolate hydrolase [Hypoxylon sp. FL1284]